MRYSKDKLISAVDATATRTKQLINELSATIGSIDWDEQVGTFRRRKESFLSKVNTAWEELNQLMKQVKDSLSDYTVTVPYDEDGGEAIKYSVEDGKLTIEVTYNDENSSRSNRTTVVLPQNCDPDDIRVMVNHANKTAKVIVPKVSGEQEEAEEYAAEPEDDGMNELDRTIEENSRRFASIQRGGNFQRQYPEE